MKCFVLTIIPIVFFLFGNTIAHAQLGSSTSAPLEVSSPNFILMGRMDPDAAESLLRELEEFRTAVLDIFDGPTGVETDKITINYIADVEDFNAISPSTTIAALYFQTVLSPRILINGEMLDHDLEQVKRALFHEYMHHLNFHYLGYNTPVWLNEGLAEYYATFEKTDDGQYMVGQLQDEYFQSLEGAGWTPIVTLFDALHEYPYVRGSTDTRSILSQSYFYAQSWLVVHYFKNLPGGMEKLEAFVAQVDPLKDSESAFISLFGMDYIEFEEALRAYMSEGNIKFDTIASTRLEARQNVVSTPLSDTRLLAELFLISALLDEYNEDNNVFEMAIGELGDAATSLPAVYIAKASNAIQDKNYDLAAKHLRTAKTIAPESARVSYLDALVSYANISSFSEGSLASVRAKIRKAIRDNPHKLRMRAFLLTTFPVEDSLNNSVVQTHLDYLIAAKFEVRNPEISTIVVPYLEASKHYAVSDRALDIAEIWLPQAHQRSEAYRMKVDLKFSRP